VNDGFAVLVMVALGVAAAWAAVEVTRNRALNVPLLVGVVVLELLLAGQLGVGVVQLAGTDRDVPVLEFLAYQVGALLVLPVGVVWALAERSRYGPAVLIACCLTLVVMTARMQQIWGAG
jgi:hypothetical protein